MATQSLQTILFILIITLVIEIIVILVVRARLSEKNTYKTKQRDSYQGGSAGEINSGGAIGNMEIGSVDSNINIGGDIVQRLSGDISTEAPPPKKEK